MSDKEALNIARNAMVARLASLEFYIGQDVQLDDEIYEIRNALKIIETMILQEVSKEQAKNE